MAGDLFVKVSPKQLQAMIPMYLEADMPIAITGAPGIGKTRIVQQATVEHGYRLVENPPWCCCNPTDVLGLQQIDPKKRRTYYAPPEHLPEGDDDEKILWMHDEFDKGDRDVQAAALRLLLKDEFGVRGVGNYRMPKGVRIVLCGNRIEDRAGSQPLITPLISRAAFVHLVHEHQDWQAWAFKAGLHASVIAYLEEKSRDLMTFDPEAPPCPYACPRSWEAVSDLMRVAEPMIEAGTATQETLEHGISGLIGVGTAVGFNAFIRLRDKIPDLNMILHHPERAPLPSTGAGSMSIGYFLCACIAEKVRNTKDVKILNNVGKYGLRLGAMHGSMLIKHVLSTNQLAADTDSFSEWSSRKENFEMLTGHKGI